MAEVETLFDRIAILSDGKIVFCGTSSELTDKIGKNTGSISKPSREVIHLKLTISKTACSPIGRVKTKGIEVLDIGG